MYIYYIILYYIIYIYYIIYCVYIYIYKYMHTLYIPHEIHHQLRAYPHGAP